MVPGQRPPGPFGRTLGGDAQLGSDRQQQVVVRPPSSSALDFSRRLLDSSSAWLDASASANSRPRPTALRRRARRGSWPRHLRGWRTSLAVLAARASLLPSSTGVVAGQRLAVGRDDRLVLESAARRSWTAPGLLAADLRRSCRPGPCCCDSTAAALPLMEAALADQHGSCCRSAASLLAGDDWPCCRSAWTRSCSVRRYWPQSSPNSRSGPSGCLRRCWRHCP